MHGRVRGSPVRSGSFRRLLASMNLIFQSRKVITIIDLAQALSGSSQTSFHYLSSHIIMFSLALSWHVSGLEVFHKRITKLTYMLDNIILEVSIISSSNSHEFPEENIPNRIRNAQFHPLTLIVRRDYLHSDMIDIK